MIQKREEIADIVEKTFDDSKVRFYPELEKKDFKNIAANVLQRDKHLEGFLEDITSPNNLLTSAS